MVIRWTMVYGYGQWASGRSVKMLCPTRAVVVFWFFFFFGFGLLFSLFFYFALFVCLVAAFCFADGRFLVRVF